MIQAAESSSTRQVTFFTVSEEPSRPSFFCTNPTMGVEPTAHSTRAFCTKAFGADCNLVLYAILCLNSQEIQQRLFIREKHFRQVLLIAFVQSCHIHGCSLLWSNPGAAGFVSDDKVFTASAPVGTARR